MFSDDGSEEAEQKPAAADNGIVGGTWDMLYKQALLVELDNGLRFIANFAYKVKPVEQNLDVSQPLVTSEPAYVQGEAPFDLWDTASREHFASHCDQTMVGFVQKQNGGDSTNSHHVMCFFGQMQGGQAPKAEA